MRTRFETFFGGWFNRNGDDLELSIIGTEDRVKVEDWYSGSSYQIEQIEAGDSCFTIIS